MGDEMKKRTRPFMSALLISIFANGLSGSSTDVYASTEPASAPYLVADLTPGRTDTYDIVTLDWKCLQDAEGTYWAAHNWYYASDNYSGIIDGSGYGGFQNVQGKHKVILSIWDTENGSPTIEYPLSAADDFSGEGTGKHVLDDYDWKINTWYTMRIQAVPYDGKTVYEQWVKSENGNWEKTAAISFPKDGLGFTWDCFFMEDFMFNNRKRDCMICNAYARKKDTGEWISLSDFSLYGYSSNRFEEENPNYDCEAYVMKDEMPDKLWLISGGEDMSIRTDMFPSSVHLEQYEYSGEADFLY